MAREPSTPDTIKDASAAYHLWDELFAFGLRMALSTPDDSPQEKQKAWDRLLRAHQRSLAERDAMWVRIVRGMKETAIGG